QTANELDRETIRRELNLNGKKVYIYIGSFGGWYLTDEMARFLAHTHRRDSNAFTIVLTQRQVEKVKDMLGQAGLNERDFLVKSVSPAEIPKYLKAADAALSFIKPTYSKQASSPTKIAEYLAGGLPIISNAGVGDLDQLIEGEGVGVIIKGFSEKDFESALKRIDDLLMNENLRQHNRRVAGEKFDLQKVGGERYRRIYRRISRIKTE
ncbi:MAG TPA: glycosyltransferase, partial [Pyrinomonadaceae bacterium]|nr:glycosyltransferase [Pyrinomonadaceae bacterium]